MKMTKSLFEEFDAVSSKQWKQKIQVDLKGADYNDTLIWQSLEGIHVKPFYHQDDFNATPVTTPNSTSKWEICQHFFMDDEQVTQRLIGNSIERGANAIKLTIAKKFDPNTVFAEFDFATTKLYLEWQFLDAEFLSSLQEFFKDKQAKVYFNIDLLGNLVKTGNWYQSQQKDHDVLLGFLRKYKQQATFGIDLGHYQNAGANNVQQLAYGLAQLNEYLNFTEQHKLPVQSEILIENAIGSNYFFEIAKLRAFRLLFDTIISKYQLKSHCRILSTPSKRNKTIYDYNVNMLRTTTECMSAILGGSDAVCNLAYDAIYHKSNEFGERIARNQLLILKEESFFQAVDNPSDGSYFIEKLTQELAEKALVLFKEIETAGGFLQMLKNGTIQKKIKENAAKEEDLFEDKKQILVGTTRFENPADKMKDSLELYPFVKQKVRKTLIEPIIAKRIAEATEKQRLANE